MAYFHEAVVLVAHMQRWRISHIHAHFGMAVASVGTLASQLGVTLSLGMHGPDDFFDVRFYRLEEKFKAARFITAIGQYARSQVCRLVPPARWDDVVVAPIGIDVDRFQPAVQSQETRLSRPFRLLCVARLVPTKGQHVLLQALAWLRHAGRDVNLTLVGDGPERAALEQATRDLRLVPHVVMTGTQAQDDVLDAYRKADAFVLPTFAEGIPVVLMEAMAMQVPVVSTWVNGILELVEHEVNGLLVPPACVDGLCGALIRLMDDGELRRRLGLAARLTVCEHYNLQRNAARLAGVLSQRLP
jgi:glycosyltransferase involved in cell wall biosynthesis